MTWDIQGPLPEHPKLRISASGSRPLRDAMEEYCYRVGDPSLEVVDHRPGLYFYRRTGHRLEKLGRIRFTRLRSGDSNG